MGGAASCSLSSSEEFARGVCWSVVDPAAVLLRLRDAFPRDFERAAWAMVTETETFLPYIAPTPALAREIVRALDAAPASECSWFDSVGAALEKEAVWLHQTFRGTAAEVRNAHDLLHTIVSAGSASRAPTLVRWTYVYADQLVVRSLAARDLTKAHRLYPAKYVAMADTLSRGDSFQLWGARAAEIVGLDHRWRDTTAVS
jgi:hypothetical protein